MKKFYSIVLAALAVCAVSCQEGPLDKPEAEAPQTGETMTFTASFGDTKVTLGDDGVTPLWENNDAITIFDKNGQKAVFMTSGLPKEGSLTAVFKYDAGLNGNQPCPQLESPFTAIYGHLDHNSSLVKDEKGNPVAVNGVYIPEAQYMSGTYNIFKYCSPKIAFSTDRNLSFRNVASLLRFTIFSNNNVKKITFWGKSGGKEVVASGQGELGIDGNLTNLKTVHTYLDLYATQNQQGVFSRGTYRMAIIPGVYDYFEIQFDGAMQKKYEGPTLNFSKNKIMDLGVIDPQNGPTLRGNETAGFTSWEEQKPMSLTKKGDFIYHNLILNQNAEFAVYFPDGKWLKTDLILGDEWHDLVDRKENIKYTDDRTIKVDVIVNGDLSLKQVKFIEKQ